MITISSKPAHALAGRLESAAQQRGISQSAVTRDAIEGHLDTGSVEYPESALVRARDLAGDLSGPEDLSVNRDYLRDLGQ